MISWFKKHFIPHAGNDHRPHILRRKNIRNIIVFVLLLEIFTFLIPTFTYINNSGTGNMATVLPAILSLLTNEEREAQKLPILQINPLLTKAAELKASDMAEKGYFAHTSPEGKTPWYWLTEVKYNYQYAGENLAVNFTDSKDVTVAWMNSPTHRANIVKGNYTEIGTGIATGMYKGRETIFVAQLYGNPMKNNSAIEKKEDSLPTTTKEKEDQVTKEEIHTEILGAETMEVKETTPSLFQKASASPHNTSNKILLLVFCSLVLILILYIVIKFRNHHLDLITNALIVIALVLVILLANNYFSKKDMIILDSVDYSIEGINK